MADLNILVVIFIFNYKFMKGFSSALYIKMLA